MKNKNVNTLEPQVVTNQLTKDVHAILSVCHQHFDDALRLTKEECFDVDAIIAGRAHGSDNVYSRRVTPAAYTRPESPASDVPSVLTVAQKGYFIPRAYGAHLAFI